jgi:aspartyl-tRNA(Asn)/glutamyl-tRNA(Gln) amidotransferase subunit A
MALTAASTLWSPIGLMIAGPRFSEGRVLALANAYEKAPPQTEALPMAVPPIKRKDGTGD